MKNFDLPLQCESFNYITVIYLPQLKSIKLMVQEHYDTPEYEDTLFFINTFFFAKETIDIINSQNLTQHRRIYYNLEHNDDLSSEQNTIESIYKQFGITEVWCMEPNNELLDIGVTVKFMPVRYTSYIKKLNINLDKKFDLGFVGIIGSNGYSPRRNSFFNEYITNTNLDFSIKIINGYQILDLKDDLADCKFILDSKRNYRHNMQNQVRLFEHICLGHTVLSEKSSYNIFPSLIYEWNDINELNEMIKTIKPEDFSEKYKEMTYADKNYEIYKNNILFNTMCVWQDKFFNSCGLKRYDIINKLIKKFDYKSYLEIGVSVGETFKNVVCDNKVSVDTEQYGHTTFKMTSDEYFNQLPQSTKFDIIFIDNMHLWECCYNNIENSLKHLSPNGIIVCHDMNPFYYAKSTRNPNTDTYFIGWNGDVWKSLVKVRTEHSDIYSCMIEDCDEGLGIIAFGSQNPLVLNKPFDKLNYTHDFKENKKYLMNTISATDFIEHNKL